jgi:hypothetical protein
MEEAISSETSVYLYYFDTYFNISRETFMNRIAVEHTDLIEMAVFWVVAPCSLVEVYRCFRGA